MTSFTQISIGRKLWLNGIQKNILDVFDESNLQLFCRPTHIKVNILDLVATSDSHPRKLLVHGDPFSYHFQVHKTIFFRKSSKYFVKSQLRCTPNHRLTKLIVLNSWVLPMSFSTLRPISQHLNYSIVSSQRHSCKNKTNRFCELTYYFSSHNIRWDNKFLSASKWKCLKAASLKHAFTNSVELVKIVLFDSFIPKNANQDY